MSVYVFGYGSLMNVGSAGRLLGRNLAPGELNGAWLNGYVRTWSLRERVFSASLGREITAVFLDLTPDPAARCNGVLLTLDEAEMERMRRREKNYDMVDVSSRTSAAGGEALDGPVVTFVARPEFRTRGGEDDAWVMRRYLEMIDEACGALGEEFHRAYAASTRPHAYPVLDGRYTFVDPAQAKLV